MRRAVVFGMAVLAAAGTMAAAQQAAPAAGAASAAGTQDVPGLRRRGDDVMTLQSTTRLVLVDVVVTDAKGRAVKGLKASDFTLLEDNTPQQIANFEEHTRVSPEEAAAEAAKLKLPPNTFSDYGRSQSDTGSVVFLLDALDTPLQAQMYLRSEMISYMKTVPPGTRIAIFSLDTQMRMVQGFTSDPKVLQDAVNSKRSVPQLSPLPERTPGDVLRRMKMEILTQGMQGLGRYLSGFPGRKSLIWFTGNIPVALYGPGLDNPFADQTSFVDEMAKTTDLLKLNEVAVYPVDARGLTTDPRFSAANGGRGIGGGDGGLLRQAAQHGDLDDVAEATGGRAFYNTNGLKEAIAEVADTASNYYTLAFSPTNRQFDGGYRKLTVKLAQAGLHLEYRRGYYARNDDMELAQHKALIAQKKAAGRGPMEVRAVGAGPATAIDKAMPLGAPAPKDVLFVAQVKPGANVEKTKDGELAKDNYLKGKYRKEAYRQYGIRYVINAKTLNLMPSVDGGYHGQVQVVSMVYDDQGMVVNSLSERVSLDPDARTYSAAIAQGIGVDATIAIPAKGNFFLRMGVMDVGADKAGAVEVPVAEIKLGLPAVASATKH